MPLAAPSCSPRTTRLEARISAVQKALFQRAATLTGRTLSDLVVQSTQEAAERIVREHDLIALTHAERLAFVTGLLNPAPVAPRLRQAARQYAQPTEVNL